MGSEPNSSYPQQVRMIPIAVLVIGAFLYASYVALNILCTDLHIELEYPGIRLSGINGELSGGEFDPQSDAELWVRYRDEAPISVKQVTEAEAPSRFPPSVHFKSEPGKFRGEGIFLDYHENGRLKEVSFFGRDNVKYSTRREGEYVRFPAKPAEVRKAWGKPSRSSYERREKRYF